MHQADISSRYPTERELAFLPEEGEADPDFLCQDFADARMAPYLATPRPPHRHDFHEIVYFREGKSRHFLDGELAEMHSHTIAIIPKGRVHSFEHLRKPEGAALRFNDSFLPATFPLLFSQFLGLSHFSIPENEIACIESLFSLVRGESAGIGRNNCKTIKFILQALISKIEELKLRSLDRPPSFTTGMQQYLERFNALVEQDFRSKHTVGHFASELGIAPRKLNEIVRLLLGKSASEMIDERCILEAKRLLRFSDLSIKEIAFELGYGEHSYFTKVFKKMTGVTPSEFK